MRPWDVIPFALLLFAFAAAALSSPAEAAWQEACARYGERVTGIVATTVLTQTIFWVYSIALDATTTWPHSRGASPW